MRAKNRWNSNLFGLSKWHSHRAGTRGDGNIGRVTHNVKTMKEIRCNLKKVRTLPIKESGEIYVEKDFPI